MNALDEYFLMAVLLSKLYVFANLMFNLKRERVKAFSTRSLILEARCYYNCYYYYFVIK